MLSLIIVVSVLAFLLLMLDAGGGKTVKPHPFSVHDLLAMDRISDANASPDGRTIAFCTRKTDLEKNRGKIDVWLVDSDGKNLRRLTSHASSSHSPRWSSDGKMVYFLSGRSDSSQVWKISVDGGEAEQVTDLPLDVETFKLSPDGKLLAVTIDVFPGAGKPADTKKRLDEIKESKRTGKVYDQLLIRHWDSWKDGRRNHIFVMPVAGGADAGEPVDVMKGMKTDVPSKPFGGAEEYTFTPNSRQIVFSAKVVGRKEAWSTQFDLFVVNVDGRSKPKKITPGNRAVITNPAFSPDGKTLACLAMVRAGYEADRLRIALMNWPNGKLKMLTEHWDRSAHAIVWSKDGKTIYTHADHLGQHPLFAVKVAGGNVKQLTRKGKVTEIAVAGDRIVYGMCHHQSPVELYSIKAAGGASKQITHINGPQLAAVKMGDSEQFTFKGWNDDTVYCYVVKPVDFSPKKKYPVAFLIHGGPQGSFGNDFHYRWNPQVYTGAGYAVIMVDFHASTGYGQDFTDAINNHWGDRPVEDLQKGLAAALKKYPWMDANRIGALGASYGGYMINWIHGVWNEPFKCLICHDGNIDERMAYYDTEELWFPEWERSGTPWANPDAYTHHNPIDHIGKWCKPTLIIHGGKDYRVVDVQGISAFTALQRKGVKSRLIYFPDENHWVLKPHNSIQWHEEVIGWLNKYLKK
ncbi:MAG: S9 family peptidase [Phycisphaerales bacterium]|nr:MAG: S9 family peptidase [Phycisphaerales bacterium]